MGFVDSVDVSGRERSKFSWTCNRFRQYLGEKGGVGELSLSLSFKAEGKQKGKPEMVDFRQPLAMTTEKQSSLEEASTTPLALFPQHAGFGSDASHTTGNRGRTTMGSPRFYRMGAKGGSGRTQMTIFYGGKMILQDDVPPEKAEAIMQYVQRAGATPKRPAATMTATICDLPLARKAFLQRFLERRNERMCARAPYRVSYSKPISTKEDPMQSAEPSETILPLSLGL